MSANSDRLSASVTALEGQVTATVTLINSAPSAATAASTEAMLGPLADRIDQAVVQLRQTVLPL